MKVFLITLLLLCSQCIGGSREYKVARRFVDSYYVMADHQAALPMVVDVAKLKIEQEIALLGSIDANPNAYKARAIEFRELKTMATDADESFLFELTIHNPNDVPNKINVVVTVDTWTQKIKFFGEI